MDTPSVQTQTQAPNTTAPQQSKLHGWKYQMELAHLHFLNQDYRQADITYQAFRKNRGWAQKALPLLRGQQSPLRTFYSSPYFSLGEAVLAASIFASTRQYEKAVKAYGKAARHKPLYAPTSLRYIAAITQALNNNPELLLHNN